MYIYKLLAHVTEMFPQAIDFGTDGINFNKCFDCIKYISDFKFIISAFFPKIDFMLDMLLVFGIHPRFYVLYLVIANPTYWFACCY